MKLKISDEQMEVVTCRDNAVVTACAGSGKTHTNIAYAAARPKAKLLYIAFNAAIKQEAAHKFAQKELKNITVLTAHGLAYREMKIKRTMLKQGEYNLTEIIEICGINGEHHEKYLLASLVLKSFAVFCNLPGKNIEPEDLASVFDKNTIKKYFSLIRSGVSVLAGKMHSGYIPMTHDFYLKLFQLKKPVLPFTHILFDEAQDASPVMLDIVGSQPSKVKRILTGDQSQSIYGFRMAVNALNAFPYERLSLSSSYRFGQPIANVANNILSWKKLIGTYYGTVNVKGVGGTKSEKEVCYISRSNAGVMKSAILAVESLKPRSIWFEGGASGYSFISGNSPIYDALSIMFGKFGKVKNPAIRHIRNMEELKRFAETTGDKELSTSISLAQMFSGDFYSLKDKIKRMVAPERSQADLIFGTVHKCKGLEYDKVVLSDDFVKLHEIQLFSGQLKKMMEEGKEIDFEMRQHISELNEEINMLYVAVTRTKNVFKL
jgi:superfamily I DNA/RNA helicase